MEDEHDEMGNMGESAAAEEPEAAAPPPSKLEAPPNPAPASASAIYLTDKELLEMQSRTDDGEVAE
jgi:hypothetical protein